MNYIKFYIEDDKPVVKIHKNDKSTIIRKRKNIKKILEICSKYHHEINDECTLTEDILLIAHDYEEYRKKENRNNIKVVGEIKPNMKVKRKDITFGKIIVATTLSAVIASTIIGAAANAKTENNNSYKRDIQYEKQINTEDDNIELIDGQNMVFTATDNEEKQETSYELQEGEDIVAKIETDGATINIIGDENENQTEEELRDSTELTNMFKTTEFHFTCDDPIDINAMANAQRYDDLFEKYGNDYGIDKMYAECSAAQETNGDHYGNIDAPYAIGIMQIERTNLDKGKYIEAYNFTTGQIDRIELTSENAMDLEKNIQIGMMMKQEALKRNNYNILVGTQEYNMGCGNMDTLLATCSDLENINESDLRNNIDNQQWLNYREFLHQGDPKYIEHNFRYLPNGYTIKIRRIDNGEYETLTVFDDTQNKKEY